MKNIVLERMGNFIGNLNINDLEQLKQIMDSLSLYFPISISCKDGKILMANQSFIENTGYSLKELKGRTHAVIKHKDTPFETYTDMWTILLAKKDYFGVIKNQHKNGSALWHAQIVKAILDDKGDIAYFFSFRIDISETIKMQHRLSLKNEYDEDTHLQKNSVLKKAIVSNEQGFLAIFGIDNFYEYANIFGEEFSKKLLKNFARRLNFSCANFDCYSLNEHNLFAMYTPIYKNEVVDKKNMKAQLLNIKKELLRPYKINGADFNIGVNIGVAYGEQNELEQHARFAYESANERNLEILYYEENMNLKLKMFQRNNELLNEIKMNIEKDNFILHYQPIFNTKIGKVDKYECLVRMINRLGDLSYPDSFMGIAKAAKHYNDITKIVINKAFEMFEDRSEYFSINISYEDIKEQEMKDFIIKKVKAFKEPQRVIFELLEDEDTMKYFDEVNKFFKALKKYGVRIAIDDFGTGYSNITNVLNMNIDIIKIDGSIIKDIHDEGTKHMIEGIINMANKRGIEVVGEFVEDEQTMDILTSLGICWVQGYHIGKPSAQLVGHKV